MSINRYPLLISLFGLALVASSWARAAYITDEFLAPLRSGQTNAYRIIAQLRSGMQVDVLEQNTEAGYSRIRTANGSEGWILSRYLEQQPIARDRLKTMQGELEKAQQRLQNLDGNGKQLQEELEQLSEGNQTLTIINNKLQEELNYVRDVSGNAISINERNQKLIEDTQHLQNQVELLAAEKSRLEEDRSQDFFLYGAGAILLGLIVGFIAPNLRPKRKDTGWV